MEKDQALMQLAVSLLNSGYCFVAPTPETHRRVNARPDSLVARDIAGIFGWSRPFAAVTLGPELFALAVSAGALVPEGDLWRSLYRVSTLNGLGFVHSAYPTQGADAVFFGPDTYRFGRVLHQYLTGCVTPRKRVVDIGCGAGAAAMLIARAWPDAAVTMLDINPEALRLARINADNAGLERIEVAHSDLLTDVSGQFDLIVANPPYLLDARGRVYRDGGGRSGAGLSLRIIEEAILRLAPGGTLLLYTGAAIVNGENGFLVDAGRILTEAGFAWTAEEIDPDVFGEELDAGAMDFADRIAVLWLVATRPGLSGHDA